MGTGTSSRAALGIAIAALILAGCGGHGASGAGVATQGAAGASATSQGAAGARTSSTTSTHQPAATPPAFAWLRPSAPPAGWPIARIPSGAAMAYPPGWVPVKADPGTASVALFSAKHTYLGYLNITPRQGNETLANWGHFRVDHNAEEGDRNLTTVAVATGRHLGGGAASCVQDAYTTSAGIRYMEIACLAAGRRTSVVIVGAGPPTDWATVSPLLERAITSLSA